MITTFTVNRRTCRSTPVVENRVERSGPAVIDTRILVPQEFVVGYVDLLAFDVLSVPYGKTIVGIYYRVVRDVDRPGECRSINADTTSIWLGVPINLAAGVLNVVAGDKQAVLVTKVNAWYPIDVVILDNRVLVFS